MSWDFNTNNYFDSSIPYFEDCVSSNQCPPSRHSHCSMGFDHSAFGSGSSVLSNFEPPSNTDLFTGHSTRHFYESIPKTQQELEAVIAKLQAVYLYRQGLKALAEERLTAQNTIMDSWTDNGLVPPQTQSLTPTTVPGSMNSIWRMDQDPVPSNNKVTTPELTLGGQYLTHNEVLARCKVHERRTEVHNSFDASNRRRQRRNDHRQNSARINLNTPQWDEASWNPRMKGQSTGHGTGVFLPPHLSPSSTMCEKETPQDQ